MLQQNNGNEIQSNNEIKLIKIDINSITVKTLEVQSR